MTCRSTTLIVGEIKTREIYLGFFYFMGFAHEEFDAECYAKAGEVYVNYNSYESEVKCEGNWVMGKRLRDVFTGKEINRENISIPPLGIRILEPV